MRAPKTQNCTTHFSHFFITEAFKKSTDCINAVVSNNCSTIPVQLRKFHSQFVGCYSHRFHLMVRHYVKKHATLVDNFHYIMMKLSNQIRATRLKKYTPIKAKTNNPTHWNLTFSMLEGHEETGEFYEQLKIVHLDDKLPTNWEETELDALLQELEGLKLVTRKLQCDITIFSDAKALFDGVIENYTKLSNSSSSTSTIMKNAPFESSNAKFQSREESKLTTYGRKTVKHLETRSSVFHEDMIPQNILFAKKLYINRNLTKFQMRCNS